MSQGTVLRISSFVDRRRERRVERDASCPTVTPTARLRAVAVAFGLAGSLVAISPSPGTVLALEPTVSGPAASLSRGLQTAERIAAPPPTSGPQLDAEVQAILDSVNAARTARGIAPLAYHDQLTEAALAHAADQFSRDCLTTLSHSGTDGSSPGDRIARTGLRVRTWGENVACNQQSPAQVMTDWMNSSGHRANILNSSFTHIGISITRDSRGHPYWMQVFGTPR